MKKSKPILLSLVTVIISLGVIFTVVRAGNLISPGTVGPTMRTLQEIYDLVATRSSHSAANVWTQTSRTLTGPRGQAIAMSAKSGSMMSFVSAATYCYNLSAPAEVAVDGDRTSVYSDWRLPSLEEASVFVGTINEPGQLWTSAISWVDGAPSSNRLVMEFSTGGWGNGSVSTGQARVRCAR